MLLQLSLLSVLSCYAWLYLFHPFFFPFLFLFMFYYYFSQQGAVVLITNFSPFLFLPRIFSTFHPFLRARGGRCTLKTLSNSTLKTFSTQHLNSSTPFFTHFFPSLRVGCAWTHYALFTFTFISLSISLLFSVFYLLNSTFFNISKSFSLTFLPFPSC